MVLRIQYLFKAALLGVLVWGGWVFYGYFFDNSLPQINLLGLNESGYYCNDIHCTLSGKDSYKVSNVSVWLDDKPLVSAAKINKQEFEHDISFDTLPIQDGKHTIKIEAADGTFRKNKSTIVRDFYVDNVPLQAC